MPARNNQPTGQRVTQARPESIYPPRRPLPEDRDAMEACMPPPQPARPTAPQMTSSPPSRPTVPLVDPKDARPGAGVRPPGPAKPPAGPRPSPKLW